MLTLRVDAAREHGIKRLHANVQFDNEAMIALLHDVLPHTVPAEPQARSATTQPTSPRELQADGTYRMFGTKMWISGADHERCARAGPDGRPQSPYEPGRSRRTRPAQAAPGLAIFPMRSARPDRSLPFRNSAM